MRPRERRAPAHRPRAVDPLMFQHGGPTFLELAQQALSSTDRGYDLIARKFDRTPFRTPDHFIERSLVGVDHVRAALDVACGTGAGVGALLSKADHVVGLDRSLGMMEEARRRHPRAHFIQGDALAMPFAPGTFDVVTC